MGQGMRVTVDAAMRARDVSRIFSENETPAPPPKPAPRANRRAEKRRLAKRGAHN